MDTTTATNDQLFAAERRGEWEPSDLRASAAAMIAGTHAASPYLSADVAAATAANMQAEADRIETEGRAASRELNRRRRAAKPFRGYVA